MAEVDKNKIETFTPEEIETPVAEEFTVDESKVETPIVTEAPVETPVEWVVEQPVIEAPKIKVPEIEEAPVEAPIKDVVPTRLTAEEEAVPTKTAEDFANEKRQFLEWFNTMLQWWADKTAINAYLDKYRNLYNRNRAELSTVYKNNLKTTADQDFVNKYWSMNNEELYSATQNGDVVYNSDQYNLLSEEQRKNFEAYKKWQDTLNPVNKDTLANDNTNIISLDKLIEEEKNLFSTNIKERYNAVLNSDEINQTATELEAQQNAINEKNDKIEALEDEIRAEYPKATNFEISAIYSDRVKALNREKNTLVNEYNSKLWTYKSLKDNASLELKVLEAEDAQNREIYKNALGRYNTAISTLSANEKARFEAENKVLAENTKFQRELFLKDYQAKLDAEKKTWWKYEVDRDWQLLYIIDGKAESVLKDDGELVFTEDNEKTKWYTDTIKSDDWVYSVFRTYTDGRKPDVFTYWADGNMANEWNINVYNSLSKLPDTWLQCWAAANRYLKNEWVKDVWFGDSYESKSKHINSATPSIWWLAIWNPWEWAIENWHVWIVTWINWDGTLEVTDWNWKWKETKSVHNVSLAQIEQWNGWFLNFKTDSQIKAENVWFDTSLIPLYNKFNSWDFTSVDYKTIKNLEITESNFAKQSELYRNFDDNSEITWYDNTLTPLYEKYLAWKMWDSDWDTIDALWKDRKEFIWESFNVTKKPNTVAQDFSKEVIDLANQLKKGSEDIRLFAKMWWVPFTASADYRRNFDTFISKLSLQNLTDLKAQWATFGALSDNELNFIQSAATGLDLWMTEEWFNKELDRIITKLQKVNIPENPPIVSTWNSFKDFEKKKENKSYDYTKY